VTAAGRGRLRTTGWVLLLVGAVAALGGLLLVVLQPTLPWEDTEDPPLARGQVDEVDPATSVPGPVVLVGLERDRGTDLEAVLEEAGSDPIEVGDVTPHGLHPVFFADEAARDEAADALGEHDAVRVIHRPDPLGLEGASRWRTTSHAPGARRVRC